MAADQRGDAAGDGDGGGDAAQAATVPASPRAGGPAAAAARAPGAAPGATLATTHGDATIDSGDGHDGGGAAAGGPSLPNGTVVGRFVVIGRVGAGGMGEVYSAFDPELDRRVALKLLRADIAGASDLAEARLRREARTMARLVDRNLVMVHDVGVHAGRVFVAMEFVDGTTLRTWCEGKRWDEVLAAFLDAGRGLAAAHAAAIVHRDFKPDNVLVARDGRVAVTDFGIARTPGAIDSYDAVPIEDIRLTTTGAIVGTPRYMAPEQLEGTSVDARSDQFAFCVALWEALYRDHPFAAPGCNFPALRDAVLGGALRPPPASKVPPRVHKALVRGLAVDPAARWPSVLALLDALDVLAPTRRWMWITLGAAGVIAAAAVAFGAWQARHRVVDAGELCQGSEGLLAGVWDGDRNRAVADAFRASRLAYADVAFNGVRVAVDDWAKRWVDARTHACRATRVYRERSEATLDAEMRCFDDQRLTVRAFVDELARAGSDEVDQASWSLARLPRPERCGDVTQLGDAVAPPPSDPARARLVAWLQDAARVGEATLRVGKYGPTLIALGPPSIAARTLGDPALEAHILLIAGEAAVDLGAMDLGRSYLERAARLGEEARDDLLRADADGMLATIAYFQSRYDDARRLLDETDAIYRRIGASDDDRASSNLTRGLVEIYAGDPKAAVPLIATAVRAYDRGVPSIDLADAVAALALAEEAADTPNLAEVDYKRSIAVGEQLAGGQHPFLAKALTNYGAFLIKHDRSDEALPLFRRSLALKEATLGADAPSLGFPLQNIAVIERDRGDLDAAERDYQRAYDLLSREPEDAYAVPPALHGLAMVKLARGQTAQAAAMLEQVLALRAHEQPSVADGETEFQLGRAMWAIGADRGGARQHALRARAIFKDHGDDAKQRFAEVERWLRDPAAYVPGKQSPF